MTHRARKRYYIYKVYTITRHNTKITDDTTKPVAEGESLKKHDGDLKEDECRCKEGTGKTIPQLLKIAFNDLAFWKKAK